MKTYKIIRNYFNPDYRCKTIRSGLTREEAVAHCCDPETSSTTCIKAINVRRTQRCGRWFDGFTEEE